MYPHWRSMVTKQFIARIQGSAAAADTLEGIQTLKSDLRSPKNACSLKGHRTEEGDQEGDLSCEQESFRGKFF